MHHVFRIVVLLAALAVALVACTPAEKGIGPEVTGTVVGYDGPRAPIVVFAYDADPASSEAHELGRGTVEGTTIRFTLSPAPEATLYAAEDTEFDTSEPEVRLAIAFVLLADGQGEFFLGSIADPTQDTVGDVLAVLMYADRPATLTATSEGPYEPSGSFTVRKGWNVVAQTLDRLDELDRPYVKLSAGNLADYDWYYDAYDPAF